MALKDRYEKLSSDRTQFLQRARHNALLTIPSLMPLEGQNSQSHLVEPYQGLGADAVAHLASRMLIAHLPAGRPPMRLDLPPEKKMQIEGEIDTAIAKGLALSEQLVQGEIESKDWRGATLMSLMQLIVAGNVAEYVQEDNSIRVYRLDQYVVRLDHRWRILELIIREEMPRDGVPQGYSDPKSSQQTGRAAETVELYTGVKLIQESGREYYRRVQEWGDGQSASSSRTWPVSEVPYLVHRWSSTPGEDYGRAKVEEHIADLRSLDALEKANLEMAGMASRNFIMVAPGANSSGIKNRLVRALNGDVVVGDPNSVELKSFDNARGYQITASQVEVLREAIARSFLLLSGAQRDAERVTATEIERDIQELESRLGGTFSMLSLNMMEKRIRILMRQMKEQAKLPNFSDGDVVPIILTGLEALSRERDVSRAMQAGQLVQMFGEGASDVVKLDRILGRAFIGLGFPDSVRNEEEAREYRQQKAEAEALMQGAAGAIPAVAREAAKGGQND